MNVHTSSALGCLLLALLSGPVAGQATVEAFAPLGGGARVQLLGADRAERPEVGMELLPGDLISAEDDETILELSCAEGAIRYQLVAPFRALVDVPTDSTCHVQLLGGHAEVVAEVPTETTAGGIPLGSAGTQYSVEVRRTEQGSVLRCVVFDGRIGVRGWSGTEIVAGQNLTWEPGGAVTEQANSRRDVLRAAEIYARFDLASARPEDSPTRFSVRELTALHAEVLASPSDTAKRAALAQRQLDLDVEDRAAYNLRRVDVTTDAKLRTHGIDPAAVPTDLRIRRGLVGGVQMRPALRVDPSRAAVSEAVRAPTTDGDLALIEAGRLEEALANLQARVERGSATSRDHFALARAWAAREDPARVRAHAGRALVLHASDGELSTDELRELGELLGGAG